MQSFTKYILCTLIPAALLCACKKDLGDYTYKKIGVPVIDTTGIGAPNYIERYTSLVLDPVVRYEGGNMDALRYEWLLYPQVTGTVSSPILVKTISLEKKLDVTIGESVGEYRAELIVTDTTNQLKMNMLFTVVVSAGIEYGWMVLHTAGNTSDVDFLVTENAVPVAGIKPKHLQKIYSSSTGEPFKGTPRFIAQDRRTGSLQNWIMIGGSGQLSRMSGADFSLLRKDEAFFRRSGEVINPEAFMFLESNQDALINNGRLHLYNSTYETDALFGGAVGGDYELAPYLAHASNYSLIAAVYDKKHGKFIHPASASGGAMIDFLPPADGSSPPFDLRNIGKDLLYMDRGFNSFTHAFFKDKTGNGRWLYVMNFNKNDDGLLAISKHDMSVLPAIDAAKFYQSGEQGYVDLYATGHAIYTYDYQGANTATLAFDGFPATETITCMKIYKPRPNYNLTTVEGRLLYVATWDGSSGKVYEFTLNPVSGQISPVPLHVFEGFGKVADMTAKARGAGTY